MVVVTGFSPYGPTGERNCSFRIANWDLNMYVFHGLLCDDVGTLTIQKNKPLYSFFNADSVIDFLLSIGMKPFVELSFMPDGFGFGE